MIPLGAWIEPHPEGIYVPAADAWIDPSQPKPRALITHGHSDHARGGHGAVWATPETLAIMDARYGAQAAHPVGYGETLPSPATVPNTLFVQQRAGAGAETIYSAEVLSDLPWGYWTQSETTGTALADASSSS